MVAIVAKGAPAGAAPLGRRRRSSRAEHLLLYSSVPEESFLLRKVLAPEGLKPARVSFIMLTEAMIELARAGTGIGILPRWSAQRAIASGAVVALSITRRGMRRRWVGGDARGAARSALPRRLHGSARRARAAVRAAARDRHERNSSNQVNVSLE